MNDDVHILELISYAFLFPLRTQLANTCANTCVFEVTKRNVAVCDIDSIHLIYYHDTIIIVSSATHISIYISKYDIYIYNILITDLLKIEKCKRNNK